MKTTVGYFIALTLGLIVGWVAQQFWFGKFDIEQASSSVHSISRQQQRLINLQQKASMEAALDDAQPLYNHSSDFLNAIHDEKLELALDLFSTLEKTTLEQVLLIAQIAYDQGRYELLFSTLYEFRYGLNFQEEEKLLHEIASFVEKVDQELSDRQQYSELVRIYLQLTSLEADNTLYYLRLSYWQLQSGDPFAASQSLIGAKNDIQLEPEVNRLQAVIDLYEEYGPHIEIPLKTIGDHYLVPVTLGNHETLNLMLDTGASKTVIKQNIIVRHLPSVMEDASEILMNTANGQVVGYHANIPNMSLGVLDISSLDVVLMELPNFEYDGLLGMNVLSQFDFNIDQENAILKLLPKKPASSLRY